MLHGLVKQLNHDEYRIREEATQRLVKMGRAVVPNLEEEVKSSSSGEVKMRIRKILGYLKGSYAGFGRFANYLEEFHPYPIAIKKILITAGAGLGSPPMKHTFAITLVRYRRP